MISVYHRRLDAVTQTSVVALFFAFPISLSLANLLMVWVFLLWLLSGRFRQAGQLLQSNPAACAALALFGVVLLGVLYSPAPWPDIQNNLEKYVKLIMVAVLLFVLAPLPALQQRALLAFALAMGFTAASSWLNIWWQLPWSETQNQGWGVNHHVFGDHITQNVMMCLFVLLALERAWNGTVTWQRALWALAGLLAALSITHLSTARTGFVLLLVVLGVFVLAQLRGRTLALGLAGAALAVALLFASSAPMQARFAQAWAEARQHEADNLSSIGHRIYNIETTTRLALQKPILGWGTGAYHTEICHVLEDPAQCPSFNVHPHNQYLFFAAENGLFGLGVFLAFMAAMVWQAQRSSNTQARIQLLGLTALLLVNSMINSSFWSARYSHFFIFMAGLLLSMAWASRRSPRQMGEPVAAPGLGPAGGVPSA